MPNTPTDNIHDSGEERNRLIDLLAENITLLTAAVAANTAAPPSVDCGDTVVDSGCGCGGSTSGGYGPGSGTPPPPSFPEGSIPDGYGYQPPSGDITDRKCRAANLIINKVDSFLAFIEPYMPNIPQDNPLVAWSYVLAFVGAALAAVFVSGGLLIPVLAAQGYFMAGYLLPGAIVDPSAIRAVISAHRDELVCALESSTSSSEAKRKVLEVFSSNSTNPLHPDMLEFVGLLLAPALLNVLYAALTGSETEVAATPLTSDCSTCTDTCDYLYGSGDCIGVSVSEYNGTSQDFLAHRVTFTLPADTTITAMSFSGWSYSDVNESEPVNGNVFLLDGNGANIQVSASQVSPTGGITFPVANVRTIAMVSASPFSVEVFD